jgi:hypothetical protein
MMKPSNIKPRKAAPPGGRLAAYQHAFARLDEALAKNTQGSGFTEAEKTQMLMYRIWGTPPKEGL